MKLEETIESLMSVGSSFPPFLILIFSSFSYPDIFLLRSPFFFPPFPFSLTREMRGQAARWPPSTRAGRIMDEAELRKVFGMEMEMGVRRIAFALSEM